MDPERDVSDQLHEYSAEAKGDERPERGVLRHPDDDFVAPCHELLNQYAGGVIDHVEHFIERRRHVLGLHVEGDPAHITLVECAR